MQSPVYRKLLRILNHLDLESEEAEDVRDILDIHWYAKEEIMAPPPAFIGTAHHTALQMHGMTSAEASSLMSLPNINVDTILQFIQTHGPAAIAFLKILLPFLVKDPALLALLLKIIAAGGLPAPVPTPAP